MFLWRSVFSADHFYSYIWCSDSFESEWGVGMFGFDAATVLAALPYGRDIALALRPVHK